MLRPASQFKAAMVHLQLPTCLPELRLSRNTRSNATRTDGDRLVRANSPFVPLTRNYQLVQIESMEKVVAEGQASRRFNTVLISSFAAAALLLSLIGIYSVIAFSAALRTHELAIRLALGSQRASVMKLVLVSGAKLGLLGCGIGALAAVFASRLFEVAALPGESVRSCRYCFGGDFDLRSRTRGIGNSRSACGFNSTDESAKD